VQLTRPLAGKELMLAPVPPSQPSGLERHDQLLAGLQVLQLDHAVRISGLQEARRLKRHVLAVAIGARNAVYGNFELSARHCG
jgi:hypothetical protein